MKYSLLNFCFFMLFITLLATHHPIAVNGRMVESAPWFDTDDEFSTPVSLPAALSNAVAFVGNTWRRAMVMREWLMDYNMSEWEIFKAGDSAENDLLQARFHVGNAEVLTDAMGETDRAVKELARAETSLEAVQNLAKPSLSLQLRTIEGEIVAAEQQRGDDLARVPFEKIKANLDHLIQTVRFPCAYPRLKGNVRLPQLYRCPFTKS